MRISTPIFMNNKVECMQQNNWICIVKNIKYRVCVCVHKVYMASINTSFVWFRLFINHTNPSQTQYPQSTTTCSDNIQALLLLLLITCRPSAYVCSPFLKLALKACPGWLSVNWRETHDIKTDWLFFLFLLFFQNKNKCFLYNIHIDEDSVRIIFLFIEIDHLITDHICIFKITRT